MYVREHMENSICFLQMIFEWKWKSMFQATNGQTLTLKLLRNCKLTPL